MDRILRSLGVVLVAGVLTAMVWPSIDDLVLASPIKNWTSNEQISYSDLNSNFNHLHANLGHGHGPIITANDIASNAAIRPEQTTFGSSLGRSLVHIGTWEINPDAGSTYLPVNYTGSLTVTVATTSGGFRVDGAAAAGALSDAGTAIYTVFIQAIGTGYSAGTDTNRATLCWDITGGSGTTLSSPLHVNYYCQDLGTAITTPTPVNPEKVGIQIYSNKVQ